MSVLSASSQTQVEDKLVEDQILTRADLYALKEEARKKGMPVFSLMVSSGKVGTEELTKTIAHVTHVPYVDLLEARVDPKVLELLPDDVAERYMAVPLGEMQNRLVVAMLDADNVQGVDFLSNRIARPLKVYAASEEGIRNVLHQYQASISDAVVSEINAGQADKKDSKKPVNLGTLVQDSPISKA